ncbi:hypothetical protein M0R45_019482 [Rubus argutus]|uniref:Peptidase C1A papain C-terminal domain-containing protein n=1 Tax=Rubus argutus TaxID=59490 RepID=A0AAW1X5G2_RUBAR
MFRPLRTAFNLTKIPTSLTQKVGSATLVNRIYKTRYAVKDQCYLPTCTVFACITALEWTIFRQTQKWVTLSPQSVIYHIDWNTKRGSKVTTVLECMKWRAIRFECDMPYMRKPLNCHGSEVRIKGYTELIGHHQIYASVVQGRAVIVRLSGLDVFDTKGVITQQTVDRVLKSQRNQCDLWEDLKANPKFKLPRTCRANRRNTDGMFFGECPYCDYGYGHHCVVLVGFEDHPDLGCVWVAVNSWGTEAGDRGYIMIQGSQKGDGVLHMNRRAWVIDDDWQEKSGIGTCSQNDIEQYLRSVNLDIKPK